MKVPAVGPYFWVVKLLTTAMGEAVSDFVVLDVNKYLGVILGFVVFVAAIMWQFRTPRYRTWPYWTAVAMVAVFGTMAADVMHVVIGLTYLVSAVFYALCLIVTFVAWYSSERTLDIHSIVTRRREVFYWLAVISTFAMGTALGDLFATTFHLGYLASAFVFTALICVPLIAWRLGASPVLTFWVAYILTRPIGASFADFFGMPKDISGMGFGHAAVSAVTLILVVACFVYLSRSGIDEPEAAPPGWRGAPPGYRQSPPQRARYERAPYEQARYEQAPYEQARYEQAPYEQAGSRQGRYGQPGYGRQPGYGQRRYGQPEPRQARSERRRHGRPQSAGPERDDPRYASDADRAYGNARYGNQRYEDQWYGDRRDPRR